jgi:hypothetical protein
VTCCRCARLTASKSGEALADADLLAASDLVELVLGQKACDLRAVDGAANRLLGRSGDAPAPVIPGLRVAVLLAQASTHLWHGRHEDVGSLLDEARAEAERDGLPGLELEALSMTAFVESYWSRMNRAEDAAQRAQGLARQKGLATPAVLELAAALRSLTAGDLDGQARTLRRILLPDTVGSDPGLAPALMLGQASVLLACGQVDEARIMLHRAGRHIPPVLAVQRDVMLADIEISRGRPHAALRLLRGYRASDFATLTAMPRAERGSRAHPGDAHLGHRDRPGRDHPALPADAGRIRRPARPAPGRRGPVARAPHGSAAGTGRGIRARDPGRLAGPAHPARADDPAFPRHQHVDHGDRR